MPQADRCNSGRRCGVLRGIFSLVAEAANHRLLSGFNKPVVLTAILLTASLGVLAYFTGVIWLVGSKGRLSTQIRAGKKFSRIVESPAQLIARLRGLGARGATAETFIRRETLAFLLEKNGDYVQAWGRRLKGKGRQPDFSDTCFFRRGAAQ